MQFHSDASSQEVFLKGIIDRARAFISLRCANKDSVDDLVQETLLRTLSRKKAAEIDNIHAYVNQVAKSVIYNNWEKTNQHPDNAENIEQLTPENSNPECHTLTQQKLQLVNEALNSLPSLRRQVFEMRRVDGMSHDEIGRQLNLNKESVKKHITRAMIQITQHLEEHQ